MKMYPHIEAVSVYNCYDAIKSIHKNFKNEAKFDSKFIKDEQFYKDKLSIFCFSFIDLSLKDLDLMVRLVKAGTSHRKFIRQILVSFDIDAPMYFWRQFDTYKIGVTRNSESTMHTIKNKSIEQNDFAYMLPDYVINNLNELRIKYINSNTTLDKNYNFALLTNALPNGYIQRSHITCTYENLLKMYHERKHHKLKEWGWFCNSFIVKLPFMLDFITALEAK